MANEMRLIDANAFKNFLEEVRQDYLEEDTFSSDFAAKVIETVQDEYLFKVPTVDAVEVVHGRWEAIPDNRTFLRCSVCHDSHIYADWDYDSGPMWYYCHNCGAKMDGERKDND